MNRAIEWLLDLRTLRFGQDGVEFSFARPLPAWGWALVVLAAAAMSWWTYRRLEGRVSWRAALAGMRAALLVLLAVLLAGPRLVRPNETEEKDWVLVLADRSASMGIRDVPAEGGVGGIQEGGGSEGGLPAARGGHADGQRASRDEQLRSILAGSSRTWAALAADRVVVWLGFDSGVFDLQPEPPRSGGAAAGATGEPRPPVILGEAAGRRTAIGRVLEQALRRAAARPLAGVVILSDGRSADEVSKATMRRLEAEKVQVYAVPLGSPEPVADLAVRSVQGPRVAFVNDLVPVEVEVERLGAAQADGTRWGTARLVDQATGLVLDERPVGPPADGGGTDRVVLTARPTGDGGAGEARWVVRLVPDRPDLVAENNEAALDIRLEDRPLRVLYFDGYPRWEYRYLKNLLVRERSVSSAALLLSEGRRFVQEGDQPVVALPTSPEEWRAYDVVVMGDVRPEMFTEEQLAQLRDHVGVNGAGILWIAGESATPGAWTSTGLADLLPFSLRGAMARGSGVEPWPEPVLMRPTALAERYGVMRMTDRENAGAPAGVRWWPSELLDASLGWPAFRWAQRIDRATLKPAAEVLAEAVPADPGSAASAESTGAAPLVLSMRFGAGRALYVATDEVWRWRFGRGEDLPERFWLQMIRMLGRESLARSGLAARLLVSPSRAEINQPVRIGAELLDQRLVDGAGPSIAVRVTRLGERGEEDAHVADLTLSAEGAAHSRSGPGGRAFATLWTPTEAGRYRVRTVNALDGADALAADCEVWLPDDELRHPEADHAFLQRLAESTGGKMLGISEVDTLPRLLPNRRVRLVGTPDEESLWDTPLAMILLLGLLTTEWAGRRLMKLA
jgi:hypothetical protein